MASFEDKSATINGEDCDYAFVMQNDAPFKNICKWIMDSGATKHMTPYKAAFDTYEVTSPRKVHIGDDSIVEAIVM